MNLRQRFLAIRQIRPLKDVLERLYEKHNRRSLIKPDPLQFVYKYHSKADMEIVALLASCLAYGRVEQIEKSLTDLFGRMGKSPYEYVLDFNTQKSQGLESFKHRFATGRDISHLLKSLQRVLESFACLEEFFLAGYSDRDEDIIPALSKFCNSLTAGYDSNSGPAGKNLKHLLADPARGSACKRLNLFLRWMVRDDDVDTGLWKSVDKAKLIVPVDVHMARLCKILGLYSRKTVSLATAVEITNSFRKIEPADPAKYDFALSRIGIVENCNGRFRLQCRDCELLEYCFKEYSSVASC
ncbi:MAG: TIGR02757 family protein [Candidatus Brocadiia bacterium]|nr:MAG: TIGR02757 family protein [Candidatus Brocadiia bacterium]